jgi:hypothetical protein
MHHTDIQFDVTGQANGDVMIITVQIDGDVSVEATGVAKRDPSDKHDAEVQYELALGRALTKAGEKLLKRARGGIRHADQMKANRLRNKESRLGKDGPTPGLAAVRSYEVVDRW